MHETNYKNEYDMSTLNIGIVYTMSSINKRLPLHVPANVIYCDLKDTRLQQLFPEFFTGITRKLTNENNEANSELQFTTTTYDSKIQINEIFKLKILQSNITEII